MGISGGPNIVRDSSLVLDLDASDRNSYVSGSLTWKDVSGNNNTGSIVGVPGYDTSNGGGLIFDKGVGNSGINCSNPSSLSFSQNKISLVIWYKQFGAGFLFNQTNPDGFNLQNNGSSIRFQIYSGSIAPSPINLIAGTIVNNTYYQVCSTYDGTVANTYVNGSLVGTQTNSQTILNTAGNFQVGYRDNGINTDYSSGSIYAVQVYNRALSATEIQQNYNALKSRFNLT